MRRLLCCLIALSCVAGISRAQPAASPRLAPAEESVYARLVAMADTRTLDAATIDAALAARNPSLRAAAALALGQLGGTSEPRIARLRLALRDGSPQVAATAAYALGLLRDTASVAALARAIRGEGRIASDAAWALGQIGEPARTAIVAALSEGGLGRVVSIQLLLAAGKLRPVPLDVVRPHLKSNDESRVWAAAYAIARTRVPGGVRDLIVLERTHSALGPETAARPTGNGFWYDLGGTARHRARAEIARALASSAAGDSLADSAFSVLERLAGDGHPHVRINALRSLATYDARARAALLAGLRDRDANVRIAAAQSLALARRLQGVDWAAAWATDTGFMYRRSLLEAALAHGGFVPALGEWSKHRDWRYRAALAAAAASAARRESTRELAFPLAADADARVRAAAIGSLAADTARSSDSTRAALRAALEDPDEGVRATALRAVARGSSAADIELAATAFERAGADREADVRVAALERLTAAWRSDSAAFTPELRARISGWEPSPGPVTRAAAANLPLLSHWRTSRIEPRPHAWYLDVVRRIVKPSLAGRRPRAVVRTRQGSITLELFGDDAPLTVHNFISLARRGSYSGTRFHRVVPNFVVQDGDPRGDGSGGPGYSIRDELNPRRYGRGVLGMALSGPDTGGSQFFITHSPQPHLDGGYTVFGRVVAGFDVLDRIVQGDRIDSIDVR